MALDRDTREMVGCYIGASFATRSVRSDASAVALWQSLPGMYCQCAVCYTDEYASYPFALPRMRHQAVGKETGLTSYIERFNNRNSQYLSCDRVSWLSRG